MVDVMIMFDRAQQNQANGKAKSRMHSVQQCISGAGEVSISSPNLSLMYVSLVSPLAYSYLAISEVCLTNQPVVLS